MDFKHCKYCNDDKPIERFNKGRAKCKDCLAAYKRDLRKGIRHPVDKPDIRVCRECGIDEDEAEFVPKANICMFCNKKYMKQYRKDNREKLSAQVQDWKEENREQYRESCRKLYSTPEGKAKHIARVERTHRTWMSHLLSISRANAKKPGKHDPKSGPKRDFDIDLDYVCELWDSQKGKCNISGISMTHQFNDLKAVSIDRIDSEKGHVKGNIQLVCQFINYAKRHHSNKAIQAIVGEIHGKPSIEEDHKIVLLYLLECFHNDWTVDVGYNWEGGKVCFLQEKNAIQVEKHGTYREFPIENPDCHLKIAAFMKEDHPSTIIAWIVEDDADYYTEIPNADLIEILKSADDWATKYRRISDRTGPTLISSTGAVEYFLPVNHDEDRWDGFEEWAREKFKDIFKGENDVQTEET